MERNDNLASRGREIYDRNLRQILEPDLRGRFVAIEVESGEYFLGSTITESIANGRKKYPTRLFYVMRVGYEAAVSLKMA